MTARRPILDRAHDLHAARRAAGPDAPHAWLMSRDVIARMLDETVGEVDDFGHIRLLGWPVLESPALPPNAIILEPVRSPRVLLAAVAAMVRDDPEARELFARGPR